MMMMMMTCAISKTISIMEIALAISQFVYMPNFRAIKQSAMEKNDVRHTDRQTNSYTHTHTQKKQGTKLSVGYFRVKLNPEI